MLSQLDNIIFPDRCDILDMGSQRYVYPIFKNGSSILYSAPHKKVNLSTLSSKNTIDVFVRDPYERFLSGVQSFFRYNKNVQCNVTSLYFISNYLFLDRHFCPQFYWLVNLNRFLNGVNMRLLPVKKVSEFNGKIDNRYDLDPIIADYFKNNLKVQFYLQVDKVLTETLVHKTVTMHDIVTNLKTSFPDVYKEVILRSKEICSALD